MPAIPRRRLLALAVLVGGTAVTAPSCQHSRSEYQKPDWAYAFVDTCLAIDIDTSTWTLIDGPSISFRIPPGYASPEKIQIISDTAEFKRGDGRIACCWNGYPYAALSGGSFFRCREIIRGRETFIIRGPVGGQFLTAAAWINPHGQYIQLIVNSPDAEGQREALGVVRSATIKREFDKRLPGPMP
jgi:hypothetical protein